MKMALLLDSFQKIIHSCALTCMASTPPIRVNWCCVGGFPILSLVGRCCRVVVSYPDPTRHSSTSPLRSFKGSGKMPYKKTVPEVLKNENA